MHATFTFWNVLDRIMVEASRSNWQTGYVREMQVRRMALNALLPRAAILMRTVLVGSKWAERAAKISSKPQMVLKSDGSVKSLH